jgi:hypothetical protein
MQISSVVVISKIIVFLSTTVRQVSDIWLMQSIGDLFLYIDSIKGKKVTSYLNDWLF